MASVAIQRGSQSGTLPERVWGWINALTDEVRQQAYHLFERRGCTAGQEVDDWLQAERELVWSPPSELIENQDNFQARIALPGFDGKDVEVTATPDALIVRAESTHTHEGQEGDVCSCECAGRKLYRRLDLPEAITVDKVTVSIEKGILEINAPKAAKEEQLPAVAE
jgi:HSP20 family protein